MTFFDMIAIAAFALAGRVPIRDAAPNPALAAPRVDLQFDGPMSKLVRDQFAPRRPAATLDDMMADIDTTDDELANAIDKVERLIEQKRAQVAALRTRLDAEDADIADRKARVARMREALRAESVADEPAETVLQENELEEPKV